jgi:hypothetical protein
MTTTPAELELQETIKQLTARMDALEQSAGNNRLSIGVMAGNLDTTIAAFIIALGAVAYDVEVDMFFTFWATAALRDPRKAARKGFLDTMFGWMLPRGSQALPLQDADGRHRPQDDPLRDEVARRQVAGATDEGSRGVRRAHPCLRNVDGGNGTEGRRDDRLSRH